MSGKRRREYLYNTDASIPARTKSRYASRTLISRQKSILCAIKPLRPHQSRAATKSSMEVNEYLLKTFKCISEKDELIYIEAKHLISLCVSITVQEKQCVVLPPNDYAFIN